MADTLYDGVIFNERPILKPSDILSDDDKDYGITAKDFLLGSECPINEKFIELRTNEFSHRYYSLALLNKLAQLSTSQIDEFFEYQMARIFSKKKWLLKLEKIVEVGIKDSGLNLYSRNLDHVGEPLRNRIKKYQGKNRKSTLSGSIEPPSFTYTQLETSPRKLQYLYVNLKKNLFITADTTEANFIKVFSGQHIDTPISWIGNKSELAYFIKLIHNELGVVNYVYPQHWRVTAKCFLNSNGKNFKFTDFRELKVPARSQKLDEAVKDLI